MRVQQLRQVAEAAWCASMPRAAYDVTKSRKFKRTIQARATPATPRRHGAARGDTTAHTHADERILRGELLGSGHGESPDDGAPAACGQPAVHVTPRHGTPFVPGTRW